MWSPVERACSPERDTVTVVIRPVGSVWVQTPQTAHSVSKWKRCCSLKMDMSLTGPACPPAGHSITLKQIGPAENATAHVQAALVEVFRTVPPVCDPVSFIKGSASANVPMASSTFRTSLVKLVIHHVRSALAHLRPTVLPVPLMPVFITVTAEPAAPRASTSILWVSAMSARRDASAVSQTCSLALALCVCGVKFPECFCWAITVFPSAHTNTIAGMEPAKNVTLPVRSAVLMVLFPVPLVWPLKFWPHQDSVVHAVRLDIMLMKTEFAKSVILSV